MIALLILLTIAWFLAMTWSAMEIYSIAAKWVSDKNHEHGGFHDAE